MKKYKVKLKDGKHFHICLRFGKMLIIIHPLPGHYSLMYRKDAEILERIDC